MESMPALLLRLMRRARFVFVVLYTVVALGFLFAAPRSGWTWFIVVAGAALCLSVWWLVAVWSRAAGAGQGRDGRNGSDHG